VAEPLGPPLRIRLEAFDRASNQPKALPDALANSLVELRLPVPPVDVGPGELATWLMEVDTPDGHFFGYVRVNGVFDPTTNTLVVSIPVRQLHSLLFLPVLLGQAYVSNFDPEIHIWSSPFPDAVDFGAAAPQLTRMQVLAPQLGSRLQVLNSFTGEPGWIDVAGVGPVPPDPGPPPSPAPEAAPMPETSDAPPVPAAPGPTTTYPSLDQVLQLPSAAP
jgi:hypothetical protein